MPVFALLLLMMAASCKKSFFTDANVNPNAPEPNSIIPSVMLPTVEGALGYIQGGDFSRFTSLFMQQTLGASRQAQGYYTYVLTSQDFDTPWGNMYTSALENCAVLIQVADKQHANGYGGIGRILMAYGLQLMVDEWGAVPYSKALTGNSNLQPGFDTDKGLYDTITSLLDKGITLIGESGSDKQIPGAEDVVYGGNLDQWVMFAHAIKARLFIHQSKGDAGMAASALAETKQSFVTVKDNAQYVFGVTETSANPWYQFIEQRDDISFSEAPFYNMLDSLGDPRLAILIDPGDALLYYGNINSPVEFITLGELNFVAAEATLRTTGNVADAQAYYQKAIRADMTKLGVASADADTYIAANGTLPADVNAALAQVAFQEYIALYLNPEVWTVWRRTGYPVLKAQTTAGVPRRFLYPQSEYSTNNANVPPSATLYSPKVFWDK